MKKHKHVPHTVHLGWTLEDFMFEGDPYTVDMTIAVIVEANHIELESVYIDKIDPRNSNEYRIAIAVENYIERSASENNLEWQMVTNAVADKIARE